jgi:fructokinase
MTVNVVGLGEILWDLLPSGPQLGGAPANFAYHFHTLGAQIGARADVITRIGNDNYGREIIRRFHEMRLRSAAVQIDEKVPTGTANVELSTDGFAHFTIQENVAWDFLHPSDEARAVAGNADAICFGTLASVALARAPQFNNSSPRPQPTPCAFSTSISGRHFIRAR